MALEETVDAVNEASSEGTNLLSSDYSSQSVGSACKRISMVNRRSIYLDVFPGSESSEPSGMDSNGQREEDPGIGAAGRDKFLLLQTMQ